MKLMPARWLGRVCWLVCWLIRRVSVTHNFMKGDILKEDQPKGNTKIYGRQKNNRNNMRRDQLTLKAPCETRFSAVTNSSSIGLEEL